MLGDNSERFRVADSAGADAAFNRRGDSLAVVIGTTMRRPAR
jgi:hypothetical protein